MMQSNQKYPVMTSEYESINVPGLFFAGQLAHGTYVCPTYHTSSPRTARLSPLSPAHITICPVYCTHEHSN